ncbi:MAG: G-D-S-L family lipolytic protein [Chitinophagaceae bacterium]|nr:G-D-S-L family lipolytic protein [Chitinophagaceae bacterium]
MLSAILVNCIVSKAQPYAKEIAAFKKQDSISFPAKNAILFVGSSSFTKWTDVQSYFPNFTIVNRGFGGSSLPDLIRYQNDIIYPYLPKQIIIYCGENDIAASDTVSGKIVAERFKQLFVSIRSHFPNVPIGYISMKPSILRWQMKDRMIDGNSRIKKFLKKKKKTTFINVWKMMLGEDGTPMPDIFVEDKLHMNAKGYAIWQKLINPYLINEINSMKPATL